MAEKVVVLGNLHRVNLNAEYDVIRRILSAARTSLHNLKSAEGSSFPMIDRVTLSALLDAEFQLNKIKE